MSVPRFLPRPQVARRWFDHAGMALLRSTPVDGPEIWVRADSGPHGFLSIAAHAHADALALEVRHEGVDVFADPGTYCYHGEAEWREWCRATASHNTLQIEGQSSSTAGGPFLWSTHAKATTLSCALDDGPVQRWSAEHDGYTRLERPVTHRRSAVLDSPARTLSVTDRLVVDHQADDDAPVGVSATWQLGPDVTVELDGHQAVLSWDSPAGPRRATLALPAELTWTAHRGETDPVRGWYAPGFGSRVPATQLLGRGAIAASTTLHTTLDFTGDVQNHTTKEQP